MAPHELQSAVVRASHDTIISAHLDVKKTTHQKIKCQFYWYGLTETV